MVLGEPSFQSKWMKITPSWHQKNAKKGYPIGSGATKNYINASIFFDVNHYPSPRIDSGFQFCDHDCPRGFHKL